ncbi:Endogenous retrovirus group 3 member 1 Env polyprotein [Plecturocebus cupreus]
MESCSVAQAGVQCCNLSSLQPSPPEFIQAILLPQPPSLVFEKSVSCSCSCFVWFPDWEMSFGWQTAGKASQAVCLVLWNTPVGVFCPLRIVCNLGYGQPDVCYDPSEPPTHMTFKIKLLTGRWDSPTKLIAETEENRSPKQVALRFDACAAINAYHSSGGGIGELLGHPVYFIREKRSLKIGKWENNKWPLERIIEYYRLATGTENGSWGNRTPIYMLHQIIRLQAALEILVNEMDKALSILAGQETQMRNAVYQNLLALDYLLAAEGGVCKKFKLTNCWLHIDDQGHAVKNITKLAHVPVQTSQVQQDGVSYVAQAGLQQSSCLDLTKTHTLLDRNLCPHKTLPCCSERQEPPPNLLLKASLVQRPKWRRDLEPQELRYPHVVQPVSLTLLSKPVADSILATKLPETNIPNSAIKGLACSRAKLISNEARVTLADASLGGKALIPPALSHGLPVATSEVKSYVLPGMALSALLEPGQTASLPHGVISEGVFSKHHGDFTGRNSTHTSWSPNGLATELLENLARVMLTVAPHQAPVVTTAP